MPPDSLPFRRATLVEQAAQALRQALHDGTLPDPLPGEYQLAARLGVSRPTLRGALAMLAREGLLAQGQGRRTRLTATAATRPHTSPPRLCVVSPLTRGLIFPDEHPVLTQLHTGAAAKGIGWEEVLDARFGGAKPEARLQQLVRSRPGACWILLGATAAMQRWFVRAGLPTLVLGTCHTGVALPSIDINYPALGWHAAGVMLKQGHRQLALILPAEPLAGDLACRDGLAAYLAQAATPANLIEIKARENPRELRTKLDRLLALQPRPTVIFCLRQSHTLGSLLHLLENGRQVPGTVSLLARDMHPLLEAAIPDLAHYSRPTSQLVSRTLRLAQALLSGRPVPARPNLITPVFIPGQTLTRLSKD